jgi:hypothetical protein
LPAFITSDRGWQFTGAVWTLLCQKLGIQHILTMTYHPQANYGGTLPPPAQGDAALPQLRCRLGCASTVGPNGSAGGAQGGLGTVLSGAGVQAGPPLARPAYTLSTSPVTEGAATPPAVQSALLTRLSRVAIQPFRVPDQLEGATHVYVRSRTKPSPFLPLYNGPYVVRRRGPKYFDIINGGRTETILLTASRCPGAKRSLYWRCCPCAAARDECRLRSSSGDDPLPADLPGGSCGERV